jgi:hypothetical protein
LNLTRLPDLFIANELLPVWRTPTSCATVSGRRATLSAPPRSRAHPALPRGIDFTYGIVRDKPYNYLKKEKKKLEGFPEESFYPSLKILKALLSSIHAEW